MIDLEQALKAQKELKDKIQNEFIDEIVQKVEFLLDKANHKDYEPTEYERNRFAYIYQMIVSMNDWF